MTKNTQLSTQPYKGTRDFYPSDIKVRSYIFNQLKLVLNSFGYLEYDGPMLEPFELYAAKSSEEIVNEQLYWLIDRGERKLAIRPEMTPTLARMVAAKQNELTKPIRWFSIPNLWRYERPQRGRLREHWQLNVDVFGGLASAEDLEICQIIYAIMNSFGAVNNSVSPRFEVRLNHRGLTNAVFSEILKLTETQIPTIGRLLDGAPKMGLVAFKAALEKENCSSEQVEFLLSLLQPNAADFLKSKLAHIPAYSELTTLLDNLEKLGIKKYFRYDPSIMRGFLYYTGMVLEVYDLNPENPRALFGGGRYDNLVGMFGGKSLPGVGFGMGDVTFANFLETHKLLPNFSEPSGIFIGHLSENESLAAQILAKELRECFAGKNIPVITALDADKVKNHFTKAEKLQTRAIIFVGENETKSQIFKMKDTKLQTQHEGDVKALALAYLENLKQ